MSEENAVAESESPTATLLKKETKSKSKQPVSEGDVLQVTAHAIEHLSETEALNAVNELMNTGGLNNFKLGGVLTVIQANGWFTGYESFKDMVEQKFDLKYRKAMYLIQNYNNLIKNQIPWEKVSSLGWTKLTIIARLLTLDNVDEWVAKASALSVNQLREIVDGMDKGEVDSNTTTSTVTTLTFKVHPDQKETIRAGIAKYKDQTGTDVDTVALADIVTGYLTGAVTVNVAEPNLKELMAKHSYEVVLGYFEELWPEVEIHVAV